MKIMLLSDAASIHTLRWARYFAGRGHQVHLLSFNSFIDSPPNGINLHILKHISYIPIISLPLNLVLGVLQVRRLARKTQIDLLNAHYVQAFREADVAWYDAHLAPDYVVVSGDGTFEDRGAALVDFALPYFAKIGRASCRERV